MTFEILKLVGQRTKLRSSACKKSFAKVCLVYFFNVELIRSRVIMTKLTIMHDKGKNKDRVIYYIYIYIYSIVLKVVTC